MAFVVELGGIMYLPYVVNYLEVTNRVMKPVAVLLPKAIVYIAWPHCTCYLQHNKELIRFGQNLSCPTPLFY